MVNKKKAKRNQGHNPEQRRAMLTTFIMLFPSLLITLAVAMMAPLSISAFAILLFFFQGVLIGNFVRDHYSINSLSED